MTKKIKPQGGIKVIVLDKDGNPKVLGTIPVWEHPTPAQKWVMENSGAELTAQVVYVNQQEEFTLDSDLSLQENKQQIIKSKYKLSVKEC